jgi:hypothetical protein
VQAALPTLRLYRWVTRCLLILMVLLSAALAYMLRPKPQVEDLRRAREYYAGQKYGKALKLLENVEREADSDPPVQVGADALHASIQSDLKQQVQRIQYLKYREMYPEAIDAIADLEAKEPDNQTSATLAAIRDDINRYYRDRIDSLFDAYQQGTITLAALEEQVERFKSLYPDSAERDNLNSYLIKAQQLEAETQVSNVRDQFIRTHDFEAAIDDLRHLSQKFQGNEAFSKSRSALVEDILSYMFNLFTELLDQREFPLATQLLGQIEDIATEFRDVVDMEIGGAVDLARSVLQSTRRSAIIDDIENMIQAGQTDAADEALWTFSFDPGLTDTEFAVVKSLWRRVDRRSQVEELHEMVSRGDKFLDQKISDKAASETLTLYSLLNKEKLAKTDQKDLLMLSSAAAWKMRKKDTATSLARRLARLDPQSTQSAAIEGLIHPQPESRPAPEIKKPEATPTPTPVPTPKPTPRPGIRIEPAESPGSNLRNPRANKNEDVQTGNENGSKS